MNRIKAVLKEKKLTQKWLADKLGTSKAYVNELCTNKNNPSLKRLNEIAEIIGVPTYTLIGDYESTNKKGQP